MMLDHRSPKLATTLPPLALCVALLAPSAAAQQPPAPSTAPDAPGVQPEPPKPDGATPPEGDEPPPGDGDPNAAEPAPSAASAPSALPAVAPPPPLPTAQPSAAAPSYPPPPLHGQRYPYGEPPPRYGHGAPRSRDLELHGSLPYVPGDPIPEGYARDSRPNPALLISGVVVLATTYAASAAIGTIIASVERDAEDALTMLIPIAGPFVTIGTLEVEGPAVVWLAAGGVAQTTGLALLIASLLDQEPRIELRDPTAYGYGAPPPQGRPLVKPYDSDDGPPELGYHREQRAHRGLLAAGGLTLGLSYGLSALMGATGAAMEGNDGDMFVPMFIPLAGPLVAVATMDTNARDAEAAIAVPFIIDTLAQSAGLAMLIAGAAVDEEVQVRDDSPRSSEWLEPEVRIGPTSGSLHWQY